VVTDLLAELIERGLPNDRDRGLLAVLDGSKALAKAVRSTFGNRFAIQRCQVHKLRNVLEHLPDTHQAEYRRKISAAYAMTSHADARRALERMSKNSTASNKSAANSLREGIDETLTFIDWACRHHYVASADNEHDRIAVQPLSASDEKRSALEHERAATNAGWRPYYWKRTEVPTNQRSQRNAALVSRYCRK